MHYEYEYEVTDDVADLVIRNLVELYEIHKNDKKIFPNRNREIDKKLESKQMKRGERAYV